MDEKATDYETANMMVMMLVKATDDVDERSSDDDGDDKTATNDSDERAPYDVGENVTEQGHVPYGAVNGKMRKDVVMRGRRMMLTEDREI